MMFRIGVLVLGAASSLASAPAVGITAVMTARPRLMRDVPRIICIPPPVSVYSNTA
jgi:hypothetical protein